MNTPIANAEALQIGSVDFVSPDEIKVILDLDAPNDVALNSGVPRPFPRINSYVLIAGEGGFLVSQIEWITIERSQFPKRRGMQDFGVLDLPYPLRKMSVIPLGILKENVRDKTDATKYEFVRGIEVFPTVGDPVLIPTQTQLKAIVESGSNRRVNIGISPLAGNAVVSVDPDRLFGRHLAVLGNTGSGKSCSVAGLIRWSVESANEAKNNTQGRKHELIKTNTRFIILDPNGEYTKSFRGLSDVRVYGAEKNEKQGVEQLTVPLWLWNTAEWIAFTQASGKAQKPTLIQALRCVRDGQIEINQSDSVMMRRYLRTLITTSLLERNAGSPWGRFPQNKNFFLKLQSWRKGLSSSDTYKQEEKEAQEYLNSYIDNLLNARSGSYPQYDFARNEIDQLIELLRNTHQAFGGAETDALPIDADIPRPFTGDDFLRSIEANAEMMGTSDYIETMLMRVKTLISDAKLKPVICPNEKITLETWLDRYICPSDSVDGSITIIDLSLLPADVTHIITSVMARVTLEALQRYRRQHNGEALPTVLIMEEAHTFIKRYNADTENENATAMCTKVFEKIAREGRKYGLGLVLSSQRPSELSPTVISQCNSFLLHRLSNDRDQELVSKLVPDNLRGMLRDLPSLPSRNAILLGWASELPVMVRMNYLNEQFRPKSDDPEYWKTWTESNKTVKWNEISREWQSYFNTDENSFSSK
ncbi:ATP-binding protein [Treponema vincentii]|uniref:ATP-binding protein n=1 Tax=Treponema vincentii TaxID=69710 RepID=UPI0035F55E23